MAVYKCIKLFFMFVRHGINPFLPVNTNKEKMVDRLSQKEKQWLADNAKGYGKYYLETMFDITR